MTIRVIGLAISERAWDAGWVRPEGPSRPTGARGHRRIAVVGSGPAGLACAQQLARAGYEVTVYEGAEEIGGLLRFGIPDFRLEKWVLERRLAQLRAEGVRFRTNTQVGVTLDGGDLLGDVDALVLACGCSVPRDIRIPGRDLEGIHFALAYLTRQNRRGQSLVVWAIRGGHQCAEAVDRNLSGRSDLPRIRPGAEPDWSSLYGNGRVEPSRYRPVPE